MDNKILWPGWKTVRLIGRGSFGAVYEIERRIGSDGTVEKAAVKEISIPQSQADIDEMRLGGYGDRSVTAHFQGIKERIEQEYTAMARLKGAANIVYCDDIRSIQHDDGIGWNVYIKMELLTPLMNAINPPNEDKALKIGTDVCRALVMCARAGIVHRDIKPQNIFVSRDWTCKLGDFGVARTMDGTSSASVRTGTYDYMAPEVYNGQHYGARADLYSLGMVMYWLLNDCVGPFLPRTATPPTMEMKTAARDRRFRGEKLPPPAHGGAELKGIVLKACAFDPQERYQSAEEMLRALQKLSGKTADDEELLGTMGVLNAAGAADPGARSRETVGIWSESRNQASRGGRHVQAQNGAAAAASGGQKAAARGGKKFYCGKCGAPLEFGTKYCTRCGAAQKKRGGKKALAAIGAIAALAVIAVVIAAVLGGAKEPAEETRTRRRTASPSTSAEEPGSVIIGPEDDAREAGTPEAHVHEWGGWIVEKEPGCESSGVEVRTCILDQSHQERQAIPPLGHDWMEATTSIPRTCRRCGLQEGEPLPPRPGPQDMAGCDSRIVMPLANSWLPDYVTRSVKPHNARCIVLRYKPEREYKLEGGYEGNFLGRVWDKETVTVLAQQGGFSLIRTSAGMIGWVMSEHLVATD